MIVETNKRKRWEPKPNGCMIDLLGRLLGFVAALFERAGIIERSRLRETVDLAWPRVITGFAIMSKQTADLAMVGVVLGAPAVAGLAFAGAYWSVGKFVAIGVAGGTVSLVSQNYGSDEASRAALVVKQSIWIALGLSVPIVVGYVVFAPSLIGLLSGNEAAIGHGTTYLVVVAPALVFEFLNMIASRTYAGVSDTLTPMIVRAGGAIMNILLSGVLIFGFGFGVMGAALGTAVSTGLVTLVFSWGMFGRTYFGTGASPVALSMGGPQFDVGLMRQLVTVSTPLVARRLSEGLVVFPLLGIADSFGADAVAALEVGRRVRNLANSVTWGFSIAASTLVGQRLGRGEETEAGAFGREIIALSLVIYLFVAAGVAGLAEPIATVFVDDPAAVALTTSFVLVAAVSVIPLGVGGSATGVLRGAGDTRIPFYASLIGLYLCALPTAYLGLLTPLGVSALYIALVVETTVPAGISLWRFRTDRWKAVSRAYRPAAVDD
ncbi:putative MATE family efflux protein [Halohasta litchfieldiae]|nr:MATE family efflux transporter [Halohasta litchfieldiae]ATW87287.1 putative MATE family efflux protein [Halohasta litchfieldiae]